MARRPVGSSGTAFASARRAEPETLAAQRDAFLSDAIAVALLDAMPGPAMVVNPNRQIVAVNGVFRTTLGVDDPATLVGLRPGEAIGCRHAGERPGGCGTTRHCAHCGAVNALLECLVTHRRVTKECRIVTYATGEGRAFDFRVHATQVVVAGEELVVVGLEDIAGEKRRRVLERVFFQSVLDSLRGVNDIAGLLSRNAPDTDLARTLRSDLHDLAQLALDQVEGQRQLLAAEEGDLVVEPAEVDLRQLLADVTEVLWRHPEARGRDLRLECSRHCRLRTDEALLRNVVGSLLHNAIEASRPGGTVSMSCECEHDVATISVHNDGVIPEDVQLQIFQRSFTTKGAHGRGVGTYGARLIAEQYLHGSVDFISNERLGTLFVVMVPHWTERPPAE